MIEILGTSIAKCSLLVIWKDIMYNKVFILIVLLNS